MSHCGDRSAWDEKIQSFVMDSCGDSVFATGGAKGTFDLQAILHDGDSSGRLAAKAGGFQSADKTTVPIAETLPDYRIEPFWQPPKFLSKGGAAFVDLQSDATLADIELVQREALHTQNLPSVVQPLAWRQIRESFQL